MACSIIALGAVLE